MIKLAHLTDLHLRESIPGTSPVALRRSRGGLARLAAALREIRAAKPDGIVLTGDLIDAPEFWTEGVTRGFSMPEALPWREWILQDYRAIRALLEETGRPYFVVPGNHDSPPEFDEVFSLPSERMCAGFRIVSFHDYEFRGNVPRRFVPSRDLFRQVLTDARPEPQIHLQHYLLHERPGQTYPYSYAECAELRRRIEESGRVRLCLSGHYHRGVAPLRAAGTDYSVAPAFCDAPHRWQMLEVTPEEITVREHSLPAEAGAKAAVFLDRDGVINDLASYSWGPERFRLIPGAAGAIRRLNESGRPVVVVTSQSAIGMGYVPDAVVRMVHETMHAFLAREGAFLDAVYYSASAGEASVLPELARGSGDKALLVQQAVKELALAPEDSWLVGDRVADMAAAHDCGVKAIHALTGDGENCAARVREAYPAALEACDLAAAVDRILSRD